MALAAALSTGAAAAFSTGAAAAQAQPAPQPQTTATAPATAPATDPPPDRDAEARALYQAGRASYDAGRYDDALSYFQRSYELSGRPALLYNVAQAADRLRMDATTLAALRAYLEAMPEAPNRNEVENRIRAIEAVMATDDDAQPVAPPDAAAAEMQPAPAAALAADPATTRDADDGLLSQWWFWAGAGALVVGVVGVSLAAAGGDGGTRDPVAGSDGVVIMTLGTR